MAYPNDETEFSLPEFESNTNNISDDSEASSKTVSSSTKNETKQTNKPEVVQQIKSKTKK
jgi:hypothetical protein